MVLQQAWIDLLPLPESDKAIELNIFGLVHHTHASAAQFLDDAVVRDGLTDQSLVRIVEFTEPAAFGRSY
jgi:hypothetical protein